MKRVQVAAGLVLTLTVVAACGTYPGPESASSSTPTPPQVISDSLVGLQQCQAHVGQGGQLMAAYDSTAGIVASWMERLEGGSSFGTPSTWRNPSTMTVWVCYVDGPWQVPGPPQNPPYDRGVIFVGANGAADQGPVGHSSNMPLSPPSSSGTIPTPAPVSGSR